MAHVTRALARKLAVLLALAIAPAVLAGQPPAIHLPSLRRSAAKLPDDVAATYDVRYGEADGTANCLDVYQPKGAAAPLPCVVWIHGGAWFLGDKRPCRAVPLVEHGYVVVSVNYRLSSAAPYPAQIQDCKGAIRFLRAHAAEYHIDPNRIGAWGESAGGHLAAVLGTSGGAAAVEGTVGGNASQSSRVQCVVDWFGPTDLTRFAEQAEAAHHPPGQWDHYVVRLFLGGDPADHMDVVKLANPITFLPTAAAAAAATVGVPPFLIMHGTLDRTVPMAQSQLLADALTHAGVEATFRAVEGLGHGFPTSRADVGPVTLAFLDAHLKPTATTKP